MLHADSSDKRKVPPEEHKQDKQQPVEVLKTSKADTRANPLHGDLSEKPEKENKAVRDQDTNKNNKDKS